MSNLDYNDADWSPPGAPPAAALPATKQPASTQKFDEYGRPIVDLPPATKTKEGIGITLFPKREKEPAKDADYGDEDWKPSAEKMATPYREVRPGEAAARGFINMETYGLGPALYGAGAAGAAGRTLEEQNAMIVPGTEYPGGEMVGAGLHQLWHNHFGNDPNPQSAAAYEKGSQSFLNNDKMAQDQHYTPYILGQIGAALSAPGSIAGSMMRAGLTKFLPRLLTGMGTAGVRTAAQAAGETVSEGRPEDIPAEAAKGFGAGAALGGLGGAAVEGLGAAAGKIGTIARGYRNPDAEAGQKIVNALRSDVQQFGPAMTPEQTAAAQTAGTQRAIIDYGGERTRALARSSANVSPEGRQALEDVTRQRFEQQSPRVAGYIRKMVGDADSTHDKDVIKATKEAFNPPMYKRAYQAGDRPIWSPEIERLTSDPDIAAALGKAAKTGKSWSVIDGMGGFNPSIKVTEDGQLIFNKGPTGIPIYPNIQFWDYAQRELNGAINSAKRANETSDVNRLTQLRGMLLKELDNQVPEFGEARHTAHAFFDAENAVESGRNFVMGNQDLTQAARVIEGMKPVERELLARSFASNLAAKIESIPDNQDIINKAFLNSPVARAKINIALGSDRANQLEALLRSERVIDKARKALGNSTTARQMSEMGMAGGAVGAAESLKHTTFAGLILGGLGVHKGQKFLSGIDEKVAQRVGEMLASDDPSQLQKGVQLISKSPTWMNVLRRATGAGARVGASDVGLTKLAAGAAAASDDIVDIFKKKEHEPEHLRELPDSEPAAGRIPMKWLLTALALLFAAPVHAQGTVTMAGNVQQNQIGQPLIGALLYIYVINTVATPQLAYQDINLTQPLPWPVKTDANGRLPFFYLASGNVHLRLLDSTGASVQFDYPNVLVIGGAAGGGGGGQTNDPTAVASTGDIKFRLSGELLSGWVVLNGQTIGGSLSGASGLADATAQNLFLYLWNTCPDTHCPATPGGRGASAIADFQANKQLQLPDMRDSTPVGRDCMGNACLAGILLKNVTSGGTDTADTPGAFGGVANQPIGLTNLPNLNLPVSVNVNVNVSGGNHSHGVNSGVVGGSGSAGLLAGGSFSGPIGAANIGINNSGSLNMSGNGSGSGSAKLNGSSVALPILPPFKLATWYVKL